MHIIIDQITAYTVLSSESVYLCPFTRTNKNKKAVIKNRCNLGTWMIKLEIAGLRAPHKISLDSGLHSQKSIRAPVSKMIGLRAPQQEFQGSRAPGTPPPLGPWSITDWFAQKLFGDFNWKYGPIGPISSLKLFLFFQSCLLGLPRLHEIACDPSLISWAATKANKIQ